jgi:hypothetical protein
LLTVRPNVGYSFAAWDEGVRLDVGKFDYHFLIEDDYMPLQPDFYMPFVDIMQTNVNAGYVSQLRGGNSVTGYPSMPSGLLSDIVAQDVIAKYGKLSNLHPDGTTYKQAEWNFLHWADYIRALGYRFYDVADRFSLPYYDTGGKIVDYGQSDLEPVLVPVII